MKQQYKPYAGIGSRKTPTAMMQVMTSTARALAKYDFTLRSGHAQGADLAFEQGAIQMDAPKEIFIPWFNFNGAPNNHPHYIRPKVTEELAAFAAQFHPNWSACTDGAKLLHMRNVCQIFGENLDSPALFVLCWTPNASGSGGTGQAIRMARHYNIPVFDIADPAQQEDFMAYVTSI